ncbi:MAG: sigma factor-like helix-turn-helix DNA-binding protein, partial [Candidatus Izemoplasmatales bacterium]|nr:sigma factor-like helix-turn-helix DNA-binding protein [Candidatus Izemoplasmatales bacterium]
MINDLELKILKETLDYMKENCIGPQNAYFLFKAIKNKFKDPFSYSFFISLFDNQEIITKNFVELKVLDLNIDNANKNEEKSNYPSTQPEADLPPSKAKENKYKSIFQSDDEEYYYFTKTNKTLKSKLLTKILNFFNEENKNILDIKDIYSFLQQTFKMNSINMGNLKKLLKSERNVLKSTIHELLIEFPTQKAEQHLFDLNKLLVSKRKDFIKVLTVMGLDFMKDIIRNGISNYISYLNSFTEFDLNFTSNLQLVDPNQDKILNDSDAMLFLNFLNIFTEQELIDILNNEETLKEVLLMFMEDEKKKKDKAEFSKTIKELFLNVNEDNQNAKIRFLLPYEVVPYFQKEKISTLREVDKLTLKSLESIYNYRQIIIDYIKVLQHSLPVYLNEKFKLLIQRVNASNIPNSLWEKYVEAMCYREKGYNLEQTAQKLGMTRERIRQIERKYFFLFNEFYNSRNGTLTRLIRAFSKSDFYLTLEDINSIFSFYPNLFIYMLKKTESTEGITYIDELNVFYFVDEVDWYKELLVESEQIEDIVDENKMNEIINKAHDKLIHLGVDIPKEFCIKVLSQDFKLNGTFYSRSK